jgi:hypothetical protein
MINHCCKAVIDMHVRPDITPFFLSKDPLKGFLRTKTEFLNQS